LKFVYKLWKGAMFMGWITCTSNVPYRSTIHHPWRTSQNRRRA